MTPTYFPFCPCQHSPLIQFLPRSECVQQPDLKVANGAERLHGVGEAEHLRQLLHPAAPRPPRHPLLAHRRRRQELHRRGRGGRPEDQPACSPEPPPGEQPAEEGGLRGTVGGDQLQGGALPPREGGLGGPLHLRPEDGSDNQKATALAQYQPLL